MSDERRALLPDAFHAPYDHLLRMPDSPVREALLDQLLNLADPRRGELPPDYRGEYDRVRAMSPSAIRDDMIERIVRMASGAHDYFDHDGVCVRVACAGGAVQTFRDGAWQPGGPSYTVRQEECEAISRDEAAARFPDAVKR